MFWAALVVLAVKAFGGAGLHHTYATCYDLRGHTSSGTKVNRRTAAHNFLKPGTKIRLVGRQAGPGGIRRYIIRDTGSALYDGHLDLWAPSGCIQYGKKQVKYKLGWGAP